MLELGKDPAQGLGDDPLSDTALVKAMRRRLLDEISARQNAASVVNNIYGSGGSHDVGGVMGALGAASPTPSGEDPYSYFVDIQRRDLKDPETGKSIGWDKSVHRYKTKKEEARERKKKVK